MNFSPKKGHMPSPTKTYALQPSKNNWKKSFIKKNKKVRQLYRSIITLIKASWGDKISRKWIQFVVGRPPELSIRVLKDFISLRTTKNREPFAKGVQRLARKADWGSIKAKCEPLNLGFTSTLITNSTKSAIQRFAWPGWVHAWKRASSR